MLSIPSSRATWNKIWISRKSARAGTTLICARAATRAFQSTTTPRQTNQAGLWFALVRVRVRVPGRGDGRRQPKLNAKSPSGEKLSIQSRAKTYLNAAASLFAGTKCVSCLRGRIYQPGQMPIYRPFTYELQYKTIRVRKHTRYTLRPRFMIVAAYNMSGLINVLLPCQQEKRTTLV